MTLYEYPIILSVSFCTYRIPINLDVTFQFLQACIGWDLKLVLNIRAIYFSWKPDLFGSFGRILLPTFWAEVTRVCQKKLPNFV